MTASGESRVRVGFLIDGAEEGGVRSSTGLLLGSMDRSRVVVVGMFLGPGPNHQAMSRLCDEMVDVGTGCLFPLSKPGAGRLNPPYLLSRFVIIFHAIIRLIFLLRRHRIDVVHVNYYPLHIIAGLACRLCNVPCLWHWRGSFAKSGIPGMIAEFGFAYLAGAIVCISRFVEESLPAAARRKSIVVYNGVQAVQIAQNQRKGELRRLMGAGPDEPVVGIFGVISPLKCQEQFVLAAGVVHKAMPNVRFAVVGGETWALRRRYDLENRLRALALELGAGQAVSFVGHLDGAAYYMGDCDIVCMLTAPTGSVAGEGFGLVTAEAMAAGVPVIATDCGASPEVVEENVSGLLVPPRDVDALSAAMMVLLKDQPRRTAMGQAAARRIVERFDISRAARGMEGLYVKLGAARRARRVAAALA